MRTRIEKWFHAGENCSRILLRAAAEKYEIPLSEDILAACGGIQGGFGICGMCSALVGAVMVLGLLFTEEEVRQRRIVFLWYAQERLGGLDCGSLSGKGEDCLPLLLEIGESLQEVIEADI